MMMLKCLECGEFHPAGHIAGMYYILDDCGVRASPDTREERRARKLSDKMKKVEQ